MGKATTNGSEKYVLFSKDQIVHTMTQKVQTMIQSTSMNFSSMPFIGAQWCQNFGIPCCYACSACSVSLPFS